MLRGWLGNKDWPKVIGARLQQAHRRLPSNKNVSFVVSSTTPRGPQTVPLEAHSVLQFARNDNDRGPLWAIHMMLGTYLEEDAEWLVNSKQKNQS